MTTTSSRRSPSPFDTSALVSDDVRLYMGEGVVLPDNQGQVKVDLVKPVGQMAKIQQVSHSGPRLGNNNILKKGGNFTPAGQLRLGEVDRPDCNRLSPRLRSSLSNYGKASSLELNSITGESEHVEEDLTNKTWFFDSIPKQNAKELLREFRKERGFLIRYSDKGLISNLVSNQWICPALPVSSVETPPQSLWEARAILLLSMR